MTKLTTDDVTAAMRPIMRMVDRVLVESSVTENNQVSIKEKHWENTILLKVDEVNQRLSREFHFTRSGHFLMVQVMTSETATSRMIRVIVKEEFEQYVTPSEFLRAVEEHLLETQASVDDKRKQIASRLRTIRKLAKYQET